MQYTLTTQENQTQPNTSNGNENDNGHQSFFDLIEAYDFPQPKRGDIIQGEILRIDNDVVFVDIGSKRDAMVPHQEIQQLDQAFLQTLSTGDKVPVYVTRTPVGSEQLLVSLERGLQERDWERAAELQEKDEAVELDVVNYNKGGLVVEFGRIQGFVPNSHIPAIQNVYNHDQRTSAKGKMVGSLLNLKIIELDPAGERFVLSAKSAQNEQRQEQLEELAVGDRMKGKVVNMKPYGAFIDIGNGVVGLLHVSRMAWEHIDHPRDLFAVGDEVEVVVDKVQAEKEKVSLNRKVLLPSPWQTFAEQWNAGDLLEGQVTAVVDFGAFVRVAEGVEGLLHKNEMTLPHDAEPSMALAEGDVILVRLVQIDVEQERLSLSTRRVTAAEEISWMQAQQKALAEESELEVDAVGAAESQPEETPEIREEVE